MRRCVAALVTFATFGVAFAQNPEEATGPSAATTLPGKDYAAAYVIEPTTGLILFEENAHTPLPTASMAKMMTMLVVMDRVKDGELKLDAPVTVSARASRIGGSQIYAKEGQIFSVQTLIAATMIHSANDAAEALAEKVGGSAEAFADLMNDKARQLGLHESKFVDPHGLPPDRPGGPQDVASAHDLAVMGMEVMKIPLLRQYAATPETPFVNGTFTSGLVNTNHLIQPHKRDYFADATGIKTGYDVPAGYCITASAKRGEMELIAVVMGARSPMGPSSSFGIATRLLNDGFGRYRMLTAVKKGTVVGQATVTDGQSKTVPATAASDVRALVKRGEEATLRTSFVGGAVNAPVQAGQPVGVVVVMQNGKQVSKVPAVAGAAVAKQPWWKKFWPF
jgi:D-alanyl-D-alanine carboxypeptidase (penicillin-binding protein 5/6)